MTACATYLNADSLASTPSKSDPLLVCGSNAREVRALAKAPKTSGKKGR